VKTIQQVLRSLDRERLAKDFIHKDSPKLCEIRQRTDLSVDALRESYTAAFLAFFDELCGLEAKPEENGFRSILYAHKEIWESSWHAEIAVSLVHEDDLLQADDLCDVNVFSCEFVPREEALGFFVAENELTQRNIYDVAVEFLSELSFFGYQESAMEEKREEILLSAKEAKEHPETLKKWDPDEMRRELGLPKPIKYPKEHELQDAVLKSIMAYNKYCRVEELTVLVDNIHKEVPGDM